MDRFDRHLRAGMPIDRAMAEAKRAFVANRSPRRHPYYWAALIVTGSTRTSMPEPPSDRAPVLGALLGVVFLSLAVAAMVSVGRGRRRRTAASIAPSPRPPQ
jgi:CHAT domain